MTIVEILGIDIGGTGIKGAPVDTLTGELLGERFRLLTPSPATPAAVSATVAEVAAHFSWHGPIGCGFPAAIRGGQVRTAGHDHVQVRWERPSRDPTRSARATGR